jgi:hypothetical protein
LLFELFENEQTEIVRTYLQSENGDNFFEFFSDNSEYVNQFLNVLITDENENLEYSVVGWIAECIIKNLPQSYYENKMKTVNTALTEIMIKKLFLSTNVRESEYPRIHAQIVRLFENYSGEMVNSPRDSAYFRMINDIRFGCFDLIDFQAVNFEYSRERYRFFPIAQAALLANK